MAIQTLNDIHFKRFEILMNYVAKHDDGEGLVLRRKDVLNIIGISEGDSAKAIFRIIKEFPEFYQDKLKIVKEGRTNRYYALKKQTEQKEPSLILHQVQSIGSNRFITAVSANQIGDWWEKQVISYNPLIQRGEKEVVEKDGTITKEPIFSKANVKRIAEKIMDGSYHTDTIVLNILKTGEEELVYQNGTLMVQNGEINILDGQHRLHAINLVREYIDTGEIANIDLDALIFPLQIENLDIDEAQDAFSQFSRGLKISSSRAEFFNNKDIENRLLKELLEKSALQGRVETVKNSILKSEKEKIVTFATLVNAFRMSFPSIDNQNEYEEVLQYLTEYFHELFTIIPELTDYDSRSASKEYSLVAENFTFYGYLRIASYLYQMPDWKEKMAALAKIEYRKEAKPWYGRVTRKGKKGFSITNNNDTRNYFVKRFEKEFIKHLS